MTSTQILEAPTKAFRLSALAALLIGAVSYAIGLYNADMLLNEKGYYLVVLLFGLFAAISAQITVRDHAENIPTSKVYIMLCWASVASAIALLCVGLYNADLLLSEKGFFGMAYTLSMFAAITVQKNLRDVQAEQANSDHEDASQNRKNNTSRNTGDKRHDEYKVEGLQDDNNLA